MATTDLPSGNATPLELEVVPLLISYFVTSMGVNMYITPFMIAIFAVSSHVLVNNS